MVFRSKFQNCRIGTQICILVTSILLFSIPLSCIPMVYLGDHMLNQFTDASYVIAQKTFLKETIIVGQFQVQLLYEYATIGNHEFIYQARNTLYLINKLLINTNHTVTDAQALLMSSYLSTYRTQNYSMTAKSLPGAVIDIRTAQAANQVFQISTIIPLIQLEQGIASSIQLVLRNSVLIVYPADAMPSSYNLSQQIWYLQFMQGFQQIANASIDTKIAFKTTGLETQQLGLKAFATTVPCFSKQGVLVGALMYETKTTLIYELVKQFRNTEYTQYIVLSTGLLIFAQANTSTYYYFQNSTVTGFDQWDWPDIITNNYKNSTCKSSQRISLLCKYNSLYNQDAYIQATYLPIQQMYIISVITQDYLQAQIKKETDFVNEQLNQIIYRYQAELIGTSLAIIIMTIIATRIIFKPLQNILEDISYSILSGRLDILRRVRDPDVKNNKDANNCFQLLTQSYKQHKHQGKSNECSLIENRQECHQTVFDTSQLMVYAKDQFKDLSDEQMQFISFFNVLILSVE